MYVFNVSVLPSWRIKIYKTTEAVSPPGACLKLEVCQNALAAGAPYWMSLGLHTNSEQCRVPGRKSDCWSAGNLTAWPNFSSKQKEHCYIF